MQRLLSPIASTTDNFQLQGFQIYAVEKWIVDRHPVTILTVYTGDSDQKITVSASSPSTQQQWDDAIHLLKRDGARPKQTPQGTLMVTSLANFRSDFTIVHIPNGNFLSVRDHLYANINLLRLGCSGRSALTLQEPSETTKNRFTSMYHLPSITPPTSPDPSDPSRKDNSLFNATVLELVKLIQAALAIFGMFPSSDIDGLLCDFTVQGIQRWVSDIGEPCVGLEPMERVADPIFVSALLSFVLAIRNNLVATGYSHVTPKDPFLHPQAFAEALASYVNSSTQSPQLSFISHHHSSSSPLPLPSALSATNSNSTSASASTPITRAVLTRPLVDSIRALHDKPRQSESRKVRRVLMNKLDDFVGGSDGDGEGKDARQRAVRGGGTGTGSGGGAPSGGETGGGQILSGIGNLASGLGLVSGGGGDAGSVMDPILDLKAFVEVVVGKEKKGRGMGIGRGKSKDGAEWELDDRGKDGGKEKDVVAGSIRYLWSGRVDNVIRMRQRARQRATRRWEEKGAVASDGDAEDEREREKTEGKWTEDESDALGAFAGPWSGRMQKKIEAWAGLGWKRQNHELAHSKAGRNQSRSQSPLLPVLVTSDREEEDLLSSGQVSPVSELRVNPFNMLHGGVSAESSALNLDAAVSDYDRRVTAFDRKRLWPKGYPQNRVSSWSDPLSARARDILDQEESEGKQVNRNRRKVGRPSVIREEDGEDGKEMTVSRPCAKRRRSFHDLDSYRNMHVLNVEWMKIDVELCGQLLVMSRRAQHLESVVACLQILNTSLSTTNTRLREDYHAHQYIISELDSRTRVIASLEAQRAQTVTTQETKALLYESEQFRLPELWRAVSPPRQQVFDLREKVFGTGGRRLSTGVRGAHGRFNRLQWTLDGQERLVDWMGRTESEEEEEDKVEVAEIVVPREEEEDVVENPGIKPMWLLRFFNTWGARWGGPPAKKQEDEKVGKGSGKERLRSVSPQRSVETSPVS